MPAMTLMSVVLPAPFGPTIETSSPGPMVSETPHSAVAVPYLATAPSSASMGFSQKRRDDLRLLHHFRRHAFRDHRAVIEHDDAIRQRHHRTHHVLDEQDRRPRLAN